jgi:hypothetical protein
MADIIDTLNGMDDAALSAKFGFDRKLADIRKQLAEADGLSGDARKSAAEKIDRAVNPTPDEYQIRWAVDDAKRDAKQFDGKAEMACCSPHSLAPD